MGHRGERCLLPFPKVIPFEATVCAIFSPDRPMMYPPIPSWRSAPMPPETSKRGAADVPGEKIFTPQVRMYE